MIDLSEYSIVDAHCHPFINHGRLTVNEFIDLVSFPGGDAGFLEQGRNHPSNTSDRVRFNRTHTVYFRYLVKQLAAFFNCEPTIQGVVKSRNESVVDFKKYVRDLFKSCKLDSMVVDFGYPQPSIDKTEFSSYSVAKVVPIFRIETFVDKWIAADVSWHEFLKEFERSVSGAIKNEGYKGLKSVIAYRSGLNISPDCRSEAFGEKAWETVKGDHSCQKDLRDHLLCKSMEYCMDSDVPIQIHVGVGDVEVNIQNCRPFLLAGLLKSKAFRSCKVIMVHAGYPYLTETGYLVNILPNLHCDVSEGIPFAGWAAKRIFSELLEMSPYSKILYGSDGYIVPEIAFVGAKIGKQALALSLEELTKNMLLDASEASDAARMILSENATRVFNIHSSD